MSGPVDDISPPVSLSSSPSPSPSPSPSHSPSHSDSDSPSHSIPTPRIVTTPTPVSTPAPLFHDENDEDTSDGDDEDDDDCDVESTPVPTTRSTTHTAIAQQPTHTSPLTTIATSIAKGEHQQQTLFQTRSSGATLTPKVHQHPQNSSISFTSASSGTPALAYAQPPTSLFAAPSVAAVTSSPPMSRISPSPSLSLSPSVSPSPSPSPSPPVSPTAFSSLSASIMGYEIVYSDGTTSPSGLKTDHSSGANSKAKPKFALYKLLVTSTSHVAVPSRSVSASTSPTSRTVKEPAPPTAKNMSKIHQLLGTRLDTATITSSAAAAAAAAVASLSIHHPPKHRLSTSSIDSLPLPSHPRSQSRSLSSDLNLSIPSSSSSSSSSRPLTGHSHSHAHSPSQVRSQSWFVYKRYSDFDRLHSRLLSHPALGGARQLEKTWSLHLPPKVRSPACFSSGVLETRHALFDSYVRSLVRREELRTNALVLKFLGVSMEGDPKDDESACSTFRPKQMIASNLISKLNLAASGAASFDPSLALSPYSSIGIDRTINAAAATSSSTLTPLFSIPSSTCFDFLATGDLLLFRTSSTLSKMQRSLTSSSWDHIGMIIQRPILSKNSHNLCILESVNKGGIRCNPLEGAIMEWRRKGLAKLEKRRKKMARASATAAAAAVAQSSVGASSSSAASMAASSGGVSESSFESSIETSAMPNTAVGSLDTSFHASSSSASYSSSKSKRSPFPTISIRKLYNWNPSNETLLQLEAFVDGIIGNRYSLKGILKLGKKRLKDMLRGGGNGTGGGSGNNNSSSHQQHHHAHSHSQPMASTNSGLPSASSSSAAAAAPSSASGSNDPTHSSSSSSLDGLQSSYFCSELIAACYRVADLLPSGVDDLHHHDATTTSSYSKENPFLHKSISDFLPGDFSTENIVTRQYLDDILWEKGGVKLGEEIRIDLESESDIPSHERSLSPHTLAPSSLSVNRKSTLDSFNITNTVGGNGRGLGIGIGAGPSFESNRRWSADNITSVSVSRPNSNLFDENDREESIEFEDTDGGGGGHSNANSPRHRHHHHHRSDTRDSSTPTIQSSIDQGGKMHASPAPSPSPSPAPIALQPAAASQLLSESSSSRDMIPSHRPSSQSVSVSSSSSSVSNLSSPAVARSKTLSKIEQLMGAQLDEKQYTNQRRASVVTMPTSSAASTATATPHHPSSSVSSSSSSSSFDIPSSSNSTLASSSSSSATAAAARQRASHAKLKALLGASPPLPNMTTFTAAVAATKGNPSKIRSIIGGDSDTSADLNPKSTLMQPHVAATPSHLRSSSSSMPNMSSILLRDDTNSLPIGEANWNSSNQRNVDSPSPTAPITIPSPTHAPASSSTLYKSDTHTHDVVPPSSSSADLPVVSSSPDSHDGRLLEDVVLVEDFIR